VDLADPEDLTIVPQVLSLITRGIPVRFGIVPLTPSDDASTQARIAYHLVEDYGVEALASYLSAFLEDTKIEAVESLLATTVKGFELQDDATAKLFSEVIETENYSQQIELARQWSSRLKANSGSRSVFANGAAIPRDKNWMQSVSMQLVEDLQKLQMAIFQARIDEEAWAPGFLLEGASLKRNTYILPEDNSALRILDVNKIYNEHSDLFDRVPIIESYADSTKENWAVLALLADITAASGQELLVEALKFKRGNPGVRLDIVHNPESAESAFKTNAALIANRKQLSDVEAVAEINEILQAQVDAEADDGFTAALNRFLSSSKIQSGTQTLLLNGRVIGPISPADTFKADEFQQLLEFEQKTRILPVYAAIDDLGLEKKLTGPISAAKVTSLTALSTISDLPEGIFESAPTRRTNLYDEWESKYTAIESGDPDTASVHIAGLLNPLSEQGQRWAPILKVLSELDGVYVKLFLNPKEKIEELPVKRFFRYVLESKPSFDEETGKLKTLNATFRGLPSEALLTVGINVPPAWLVAPSISVHDLDNIKLGTIKSDVEALYELEHILIEGHSRETRGNPPRGAQLVLATDSNPHVTDTIVMANLGYFQFKANPGFYNIKLKEGRSADIYSIESVGAQGWEAVPGDEGTKVSVMDFKGTTLYPRLKRNPGMEQVDILGEEEEDDENLVAKGLKFAGSIFGGSKKDAVPAKQQHADINIFSVASGHLYERMLNIMIVSVMRHTKHTVKFWFIEQFLSPSFKDFIPYMAEEYGFEYEMVTYKWPHWLRQQKEKQREIWGYKILFLDVLFPLSLDKVIFVDADQIVRTDMIDLVNHDLQGAPYGFTPMCDSRTEMEGFRFWKQGYWASHLRGLPYHISALYVVDLRRFRKLAAGDRLRQQYHSLSADPNSLSNLDQDLPNNMQFQIPIHSLPQEWLWCETWCSDEALATARTIDLCNNPETKEPKLDRARRQVPEWTVYDDEIAALDRRRRGVEPVVVSAGEIGAEEKAGGGGVSGVNTKSRRFEEEPVHTRDEL
jgi:UDP-glucose:glycoprotein glucosyltransferase